VFPVQYARSTGDLIVVAGQHPTKTWFRHFDDDPQRVIVHLRGRATDVTARRLNPGSPGRTEAVAAYTTRFPRAQVLPDSPVLVLRATAEADVRTSADAAARIGPVSGR
jgi:hypothetical protein